MEATRKKARQRLKNATKSEFDFLIEKANLTPLQEKILRLHFIKDYSVCKVALSLSCCDSNVRKNLAAIYDKIAKL